MDENPGTIEEGAQEDIDKDAVFAELAARFGLPQVDRGTLLNVRNVTGGVVADCIEARLGEGDVIWERVVADEEEVSDEEEIEDTKWRELFIKSSDRLLDVIDFHRTAKGMPVLTHDQRVIWYWEVFKTAKLFEGKMRKDGTYYVFNHLLGAVENVAVAEGLTSLSSLLAALHHDTLEDVLKGEDDYAPVRREYLMGTAINSDLYLDDLSQRDAQTEADIAREAWEMVDAVTKLKGIDREETTAKSFKKLLYAMINNIRAAYIKLGDRMHNMETISGHKQESQYRIARETTDVYLPVARLSNLHDVANSFVRNCLGVFNPELVRQFDELSRRTVRERVYREPIEGGMTYREELEHLVVECLGEGGGHLEIVSKELGDYTKTSDVPLYEMRTLDDLGVGTSDPMHEALILVHAADPVDGEYDPSVGDKINQVKDALLKRFGGKGSQSSVYEPSGEEMARFDGTVVRIFNPEYGGQMIFRINDNITEARRQRGVLAEGDADMPAYLKSTIQSLLALSGRMDDKTFLKLLKERLLRPWVKVLTRSFESFQFGSGDTGLDFVTRVHAGLVPGAKAMRRSVGLLGDGPLQQAFLFDRLETGCYYEFDSVCSDEHGEMDIHACEATPAWCIFGNDDTKRALRNYFRAPLTYMIDRTEVQKGAVDLVMQYFDGLEEDGGMSADYFIGSLDGILRTYVRHMHDYGKSLGTLPDAEDVLHFASLFEEHIVHLQGRARSRHYIGSLVRDRLLIPIERIYNRDEIVARGEQYLDNLAKLFNIGDSDMILSAVIADQTIGPGGRRDQRAAISAKEEALYAISTGRVDPVRILADLAKDQILWRFSIKMPDREGVLGELFSQDFSKRDGLNIHKQSNLKGADGLDTIEFEVESRAYDAVYSILRKVIKLSLRYPEGEVSLDAPALVFDRSLMLMAEDRDDRRKIAGLLSNPMARLPSEGRERCEDVLEMADNYLERLADIFNFEPEDLLDVAGADLDTAVIKKLATSLAVGDLANSSVGGLAEILDLDQAYLERVMVSLNRLADGLGMELADFVSVAATLSDDDQEAGMVMALFIDPRRNPLYEVNKLCEDVEEHYVEIWLSDCFVRNGDEKRDVKGFLAKHGFSDVSDVELEMDDPYFKLSFALKRHVPDGQEVSMRKARRLNVEQLSKILALSRKYPKVRVS